jgi:plasminogen activator
VIKDDFSLSSMYGVSLGAEYRILPSLSLTGRAEFQKYMVARGDGTYYYGQDGTVLSYPKGAGAQADNVLLSVGLKGRL